MIDLSHLTEEEQERIVSVLKRDAELKKADEERIKRLQKAVRDKVKLKYLTGDWFYQTKSHRHRDRIHGSDIIRAAMRQRKPMTILEITQLWAEKPSFVNSEIQDIFVPAELSGLIDEPSGQPTEKRSSASHSPDVQKDGVVFPLQSPAKMRENPFDSVFSDSEASEGPGEQFIHWEAEQILGSEEVSPVSTCPSSSFSEREQMKKRCASMPAFLHGEKGGRDSDSGSESSFTIGGRKSSASTNFSTSSGMASMSSASSSLMSIYSLEFENVEVKGTIQFALSYVQKLGELHVFVVRCRDLAIADSKKNRSDPYVKSYLLPDKARLGKKKTTVKKKTINPIYNEILRYKIDVETLKSQVLNLSVWHHNSFGRNSFLGEVDFELSKWDLRNTHMNDFRLKSKSTSGLEPTDDRGEIRLALRFLQQSSHGKRTPKTGLVQIFVKECKNLPLIRGAAIDPFVKCYVLPDTNRKSRQKSRVLRRTANPVFNHTMVYDGFKAEDLQEACVEITVWDHDRLNNHFLGGVRLSLGTGRSHGTVVDWMDSNTAEAMLWEQMMDSHNEWVEDVLPLRMLMMAHSMSK
ncbi:synaptotagmin-like protein 2 isoform X4 [Conger conger]|uniref:synaptotagmin-like protein 2 isoform X4 n=1 Tax=Conger conger TaxID=82655 RepID=UPI002A5AD296|nr:synaptotagmin-like protein 2 isoform X4 [Conger conger]